MTKKKIQDAEVEARRFLRLSKQLKVGDVVPTQEMPDGTTFDQAEWQGKSYKDAIYKIRKKEVIALDGENELSAGPADSSSGRILSLPPDYKPNDSPDPLDVLRKCVEALEPFAAALDWFNRPDSVYSDRPGDKVFNRDFEHAKDALSAARALLEGKS